MRVPGSWILLPNFTALSDSVATPSAIDLIDCNQSKMTEWIYVEKKRILKFDFKQSVEILGLGRS